MKEVLFYYPQHFNRAKEGTNPFFNALLEACDCHGIKYDLFEEPDKGTDKPRNPTARKADTMFWTITILRKFFSILFPKKSFYWRERKTAKCFNIITFGRFRYRKYITISGSMFHFFSYLNPKGDVYDMQHGILFKRHPTFFDENMRLRPQFYPNNLHLLFWGKGYYNCFVKGEEKYMTGKAHIVGYPVRSKRPVCTLSTNEDSDAILVSLQFTNSLDRNGLEKLKEQLHRFLVTIQSSGKKILLKHHPRYNNCISIDDLLEEFNNVEISTEQFDELTQKILLHVTNSSTTAFEFAEYGIPTYFLTDSDGGIDSHFFFDEYDYPLYKDMPISEVLKRIEVSEKKKEDGEIVKNWYNNFYSPFDEEKFISLIR